MSFIGAHPWPDLTSSGKYVLVTDQETKITHSFLEGLCWHPGLHLSTTGASLKSLLATAAATGTAGLSARWPGREHGAHSRRPGAPCACWPAAQSRVGRETLLGKTSSVGVPASPWNLLQHLPFGRLSLPLCPHQVLTGPAASETPALAVRL